MTFSSPLLLYPSGYLGTLEATNFVDINHKAFDIQHFFPSVSGKSPEDIWQCCTAFSHPSIFRISIFTKDGYPDLEPTLEASRLLCSESIDYVPVVSLEPSTIDSLQRMKPRAIEVHLCYPRLGDTNVNKPLLTAICQRSVVPIWFNGQGLTQKQIEMAMECGCSGVILKQEP